MKQVPVVFQSAAPNPGFPGVLDIDASELAEKMELVQLIDVRSAEEYVSELGHIDGAKLLVLDTLPEHIDELSKEATVVFVCRSGARSANAAGFALSKGFRHVYNMKGGMLRWNQLGLPIDKSPST